ncbi:histidine kinase [Nostoc sp. DSM 114161]|jgi:PAS domain S-box-containing protein|uniref:PAS domain S-box protein n=1 Tax=Nostoc sp. DSM 114161 TaxID=3440143 RepID=UPI0040466BDF
MTHGFPLTILLIDDCAQERMEICRCLQSKSLCDYRIFEFGTATEAMKWCQQEIPDAIVLDFLLPDGNGLKFLQEFRKQFSTDQSAIVLLTAEENELMAARAMKSGAQDYLIKGKLTPEAVQQSIDRAVAPIRLRRQLEQSQEQQQLIATIALRIRQSLNLQEILAATATQVRQFLAADRVLVYQFYPDMSGTIVAESVLDGWTVALGKQIRDICFQKQAKSEYGQGKKRAIDDIYRVGLTNCHLHLLEQFEVKANLVVPILVAGELWGLLIAHQCSASRDWESVELSLLDRLAVQIAIAIQQATAYEQLQAELAERKQAQAAFLQSEARFAAFMNNSPTASWITDENGRILYLSQTYLCTFQIPTQKLEDLIGKTVFEIYPADIARQFVDSIRQVAQTQQTIEVIEQAPRPDGTIGYFLVYKFPLEGTVGECLVGGVAVDITERVLAQQGLQQLNQQLETRVEQRTAALRESEERFRKTQAHLLAAQRIANLGSWELDLQTQEIIWSPEVFEIFGRDPASGTPTYEEFRQLMHLGARTRHDILVQQAIEQGRSYEIEYCSNRSDGTLLYLFSRAEAIFDANGKPVCLVGTILDITERKQVEAALRDSERRYATLTEAAPVAIFRLDPAGQCIYVNDRWSEMTGKPTQAALGTGWLNIILPEDRERLELAWSQRFWQTGLYRNEARYLQPNGTITWFYIQVLPETNPFGIVIGYIGTLTDITERKQAESALQESERRYATLTEAAPVAIFRLDAVGQCIYVNDRWSQMTLRPTQSALGMGWLEVLHPEDRQRLGWEWSLKFQQGRVNPTEFYESEGRHVRPDGSINWFYVQVLPEINGSNEIIGYVGTLTDISDRKRTEEQLHHLSERLTLAISSGGFGIWEYDFAQNKQIWDERMYELYGLSSSDFNSSFDAWLNCIHPDDRHYMLEAIEQVLQGKQEYNVEFRIVQPNGKIRFLKGYGIIKRNQQGEPVWMIGVNFDISDRKQAEQELIRNRDLLEAIFNESADAIFLVDPQTLLTLDCNRQAVELFEAADKAQLINIDGQTLQHRPFSDSEIAAIVAEIESKGVWSLEIEYVTLRGKIFWGNIAAKPITVAGRTINLIRLTDISDRKQAQEALAKYAREVEDLYNNAPCGYHSLDSEGRFIKVNETELQLLGYTREEMIGKPLVNFFTEASCLAFWVNYNRFQERGWVKDLEYEMVCKDGRILPVLISATAVKDTDGRYLYNRATLFDISDRKQAEQELEESRKMLQTVLDTFPQRVFWKDRQSRFLGCNPAFARDSQIDPNDIIGKTDFELPWAKWAHLYCADDAKVMNTRIPKLGYEEPLEGPNGEDLWVRTNKVPLTNSTGDVIGILVSHEDITDRKQAEAQLRQTNEQLANANVELARATRLKDEFLANMSHELRTPLNAILGMSEGIAEGVFGSINERQTKAIATIERSGRHLLELINDILDLSKIESGKLELQPSDVPVKTLCDASLAFVKHMALKKNIRLNTHIATNFSTIQVDDRRLRQVLINLLSNAIKFTPEQGSVSLKVWLEEAGGAGEAGEAGGAGEVNSPLSPPSPHPPISPIPPSLLCFSVTDTGIGIAAEDIGKLFQPFIQLDSSLNRQYSGTGLGLALVQRIAVLHGGTVSVSSEVGVGSCFTLRIPYRTSDGVSTTVGKNPLLSYQFPAENAQVLVIEDSVPASEQITRYLSEMKMQSVVYSKGEGAIDRVVNLKPASIVLDLQLPDVSGWDILAQLKANPQTKEIPIIITSVVDESSKGFAYGAAEYLVKPITRAQFRATLEKLQYPSRSNFAAPIVPSAMEFPVILLAEDNQANIDTMSGYLESRGYRLILANNGQQAIELTTTQKPNLIIMDIQMPEIDGLEAIRRIRDDRQFTDVPIIALTALAMPGDRESCLAAGANEYLTKPVKLKHLAALIQQLLGK